MGTRDAQLLERFVIATAYLQNESVVLDLQSSMKTTTQLKHGHHLIHIWETIIKAAALENGISKFY